MSKLGPDMSDVARIGANHGYGSGDGGNDRTTALTERFDGRRRRPPVERVQLNVSILAGTKQKLDALAKCADCTMQDALIRVIEEAFDRLPPRTG